MDGNTAMGKYGFGTVATAAVPPPPLLLAPFVDAGMMIAPDPDAVAPVVVVLDAKTNEVVDVMLSVLVLPLAPPTMPVLVAAPPVTVALAAVLVMEPVHAAPIGQQAALPAVSAEQMEPSGQQSPWAPKPLQSLPKPEGQLLDCRFRSSCSGEVSVSLAEPKKVRIMGSKNGEIMLGEAMV